MSISFVEKRDYSLTGECTRHALETGLASAEWYHSDVPRKVMKELMQRRDGPAIRDTLLWIGLLVASAWGGVLTWGTWWTVPFWFVYGVLYGSACDSRWHECGHGTAFRTPWMNDVIYNVACFMIMREPTVWRWSHARHHTDTIIVGRDPEIAVMRPTVVLKVMGLFLAIPQVWGELKGLARHAAGRLSADEADFTPDSERKKVYAMARIWVAIHLAVVALAIYLGSWLPVLLVGPLPTMYGAWLHVITGLTQHAGLPEDVLDHRLNSRTVHMNPVMRFIYWNMNYHIEHHMFPLVPYHRLPELHEDMKPYCPAPYASIWAAYREIIPTLLRQARDPGFIVRRPLPAEPVAAAPAAE